MDDDLRPMHAHELHALSQRVTRLSPDELTLPTPCAGWSVADLLAHSIGQHRGFESAVRDGSAPAAAYNWIPYSRTNWDRSVDGLIDAFATADLAHRVKQVELRPDGQLPVRVLVAAQLLDCAVHHWDLAIGVGDSYTPSAEVVDVVWSIASTIPADGRDTADPAFAAPVQLTGTLWDQTLAHLGRDPLQST
jgi:uncharacterized protein (TIGR03086 family)